MPTADSTMQILREALAGARPARPRLPGLGIAAAMLLSWIAYAEYSDYAEPISGQQLYVLSELVEQAGATAAEGSPHIWQRIFDRFGVASPLELRRRQFGDAVEFIAAIGRPKRAS